MKIKILITVLYTAFSFSMMGQDQINKIDANGKKHGLWKGTYDDTNNPRYEGTFEHGIEVGKFTFYDNTKVKKVVATRDFSENGTKAYTIIFKGKFKVSEGLVVNKVYEGEWKYYHLDMDVVMTSEHYKKGVLNGMRKIFYKSGEIAEETPYVDGKKEGVYRKYTENGTIVEETHYQNDLPHGPTTFREPNGKIALIGQHKKGKAVGIWKFYKNGKLDKEENMSIKKKARPKKIN